jgi:hypothetical protein
MNKKMMGIMEATQLQLATTSERVMDVSGAVKHGLFTGKPALRFRFKFRGKNH